MALRNRTARQLQSDPIVMALGAGKIELTDSLKIQGLAFLIIRLNCWVSRCGDRKPSRLIGNEGAKRQQGL